ncbi:MAG: AI-2E family transporter [Gammaproteobacteria bacterium]|nr:MAG: AI-2E family transporter [Gammaproteobacteria bacterium]
MLDIIRDWYTRNFSDPQAAILVLMLLLIFGSVWMFGQILMPMLVAIVLAYLLEGVVAMLVKLHVPRSIASVIVLLFIIALSAVILFGLVPMLSRQLTGLVREAPGMIQNIQQQLLRLPERYPEVFTVEQINDLIATLRSELATFTQNVLSFSIARIGTIAVIAVYVVLVPLMVFFVLKDKDQILAWAGMFVPRRSELSFRVWREVDQKIANYIRGKVIEICIVWIVTYVTFGLMGLNYALLLSFLVGLSVIVPYVGAVAVTVPVALIAFFQWGIGAQLGWLLIAYQVIQILDGNLLVPLLFSEVVNLHPLAIITAVLIFGGLFGLWGVFFAIPLATLVQAVLNAWPKARDEQREARSEDVEAA